MQQYDSDLCPGRVVQPAAFTAESESARVQLTLKEQQLLQLQQELQPLRAAVRTAESAQQAAAAAAAAAAGPSQEVVGVSTTELKAPDVAADQLTSASAQQPAADQARAAAAAAVVAAGQVEVVQAMSNGLQIVQQLPPQQQHQQQQQQQGSQVAANDLCSSTHQSQRQQQEEAEQQPNNAVQAGPLQLPQFSRPLEQPVYDSVVILPALAAAAADDGDDAGRPVDSAPPTELMAAAAAAAGPCLMQHSAASTPAASTASPAVLLLGSSSNPMQLQFLHPLVATAAAATAAVGTQAELRRLSDWDNPSLSFKARSQTLASVVAQQQVDLGLDPDWLTGQDLMLLLQPIELEMDSYNQLGDPVDKSTVVPHDARTIKSKRRGGIRHVSADCSSSMCVSGDADLCEAGLDSKSQSEAVITYYDVAQFFHHPASTLGAALGMSLTTLKTKLRELGIHRWPSREYRAIEDAIDFLQSKSDDAKDHAAKPGRIVMLRHLRCLLDKYPNMEFDAHPAKDLIYALHKQKYKKRKQQEKEAQLTAAAGTDSGSAAVAAAAAGGSSGSAGTASGLCLDGSSTQQQDQANNETRNCKQRA